MLHNSDRLLNNYFSMAPQFFFVLKLAIFSGIVEGTGTARLLGEPGLPDYLVNRENLNSKIDSDRLLNNYFSMAPQHDSPSNLAVPVPSTIPGKIANFSTKNLNSKIDSQMRKTQAFDFFSPFCFERKKESFSGPGQVLGF